MIKNQASGTLCGDQKQSCNGEARIKSGPVVISLYKADVKILGSTTRKGAAMRAKPSPSFLCFENPPGLSLVEQLIQQFLPGLMLLLSRGDHLCRQLFQ
jgi:hypothetical protein